VPGQGIITIRDKQWSVSIANTPWELTQGLGGVAGIPSGAGMLFDTGWEQYITVTTVGMLFPLDVAFLSESLVVVDLIQHFQPGYNLTSTVPARFFLEVNAGEMDGVDLGDRAYVELLPLQEEPIWVTLPTLMMNMMMAIFPIVVVGAFGVGMMKAISGGSSSNPDTYPRSAIPEPYAREVRRELRKIPTWRLQEAYAKLKAGEPTGVELVEQNRAYAIGAIEEVLWERGKLPIKSLSSGEVKKRYSGPYLTNWQYGGYSYIEEDPAKPPELWPKGWVDYAKPEDVIAIAEREGLPSIHLAGGFWEEIGYKDWGEKVSISEAKSALAKAREHVLSRW